MARQIYTPPFPGNFGWPTTYTKKADGTVLNASDVATYNDAVSPLGMGIFRLANEMMVNNSGMPSGHYDE